MTSNTQKWFADNQANWDSRAQAHMFGNYGGKDELLADPHAISRDLARDMHRFGSLTGKGVCHLQCHVGTTPSALPAAAPTASWAWTFPHLPRARPRPRNPSRRVH